MPRGPKGVLTAHAQYSGPARRAVAEAAVGGSAPLRMSGVALAAAVVVCACATAARGALKRPLLAAGVTLASG